MIYLQTTSKAPRSLSDFCDDIFRQCADIAANKENLTPSRCFNIHNIDELGNVEQGGSNGHI